MRLGCAQINREHSFFTLAFEDIGIALDAAYHAIAKKRLAAVSDAYSCRISPRPTMEEGWREYFHPANPAT
jgi:hypothetical protein